MKIRRGITLMAEGYEILRPLLGKSPMLGADSIMGRPHRRGQAFPMVRLSPDVFERYLAAGWIKRQRRGRSTWELWHITEAGLEEAKRQPEPSREEIKAARHARTSATSRAGNRVKP